MKIRKHHPSLEFSRRVDDEGLFAEERPLIRDQSPVMGQACSILMLGEEGKTTRQFRGHCSRQEYGIPAEDRNHE